MINLKKKFDAERKKIIVCNCPYILSALVNTHLNNSNLQYEIYTSDKYQDVFHVEHPKLAIKKTSELERLISSPQKLIHLFFIYLLTDKKMSNLWQRDRKKTLDKNTALKFFGKVNCNFQPVVLRKLYCFLMRYIPGIKLCHCEVYIYTPCWFYFIFDDRNCDITLIYDSWDHPFKYPILFSPSITYCWNSSLKREINRLHGLSNIKVVDTGRFSRAVQGCSRRKPRKWIYVLSYSFNDSPVYFEYEVALIQQIATFCRANGKHLHVKPKPISGQFDLAIISALENVVCDGASTGGGVADRRFPSVQNRYLSDIEICFSLVTTFIIEAALRDIPVFPLNSDVRADNILFELTRNDQVEKFIIPMLRDTFESLSLQLDPVSQLNYLDVGNVLLIGRIMSHKIKNWMGENDDKEKLSYG